MKTSWQVIARHKWVSGATITESCSDDNQRRFTATVRGWTGFKIYEGKIYSGMAQAVMDKVITIRDRIDAGDETVFTEKGAF